MNSNKMNIELMKKFNKAAVLNLIRTEGPISRVELSRRMKLSRPSVSEIAADLIEEGWIQELDSVKGGRGRRPVPLVLNTKSRYVFGVELGAFQVTVVLCNLQADIISQSQFPISPNSSWKETLDKIIGEIRTLESQPFLKNAAILGVGVAMNGIVDPDSGKSIFAPTLGWKDVPVRDYIMNGTKLETYVEDDAISSVLAEQHYGAGKDEDDFITVVVDYGIGAGIVNNGRIFRGSHNIQGQIGHVTVDEDGPICTCGNFGCLEMMASEPAILKRVQKRIRMGEESVLAEVERTGRMLRIDDVYLAAQEGDHLATEAVMEAARYLGIGLATLINLFDPAFIVLGGGIVTVFDLLLAPIRQAIERRAMGQEAKDTPVIMSRLKETLYPVGGATLVLEKLFADVYAYTE